MFRLEAKRNDISDGHTCLHIHTNRQKFIFGLALIVLNPLRPLHLSLYLETYSSVRRLKNISTKRLARKVKKNDFLCSSIIIIICIVALLILFNTFRKYHALKNVEFTFEIVQLLRSNIVTKYYVKWSIRQVNIADLHVI